MRIADTSALYAAFVENDVHHGEARAAFAVNEPTIIPSEIFTETISLFQFRHGFDRAREVGEALRRTSYMRIAPAPQSVLEAAWLAFVEAAGRLSLPDALVVAWAKHETAKPITFDEDIRRRVRSARGR